MSIMICDNCEHPIDTDYNVEGFWFENSNPEYICQNCYENLAIKIYEGTGTEIETIPEPQQEKLLKDYWHEV